MEWILPYGTALVLGSLHALEPDHMAAVTAFSVRTPRPRASLGFAVHWAAGHGAAIVLVGATLLAIGSAFPGDLAHALERAVGATLVTLGVWTLVGARHLHAHVRDHADGSRTAHVHAHAYRDQRHGHGAALVGILHGLAGSAPAVALVPIATLRSVGGGIGYLLAFALGTAAGMALFGLVAGLLLRGSAARSAALGRVISAIAGGATIAIGLIWMLR